MKQCAQGGHFFDASIHSDCPYCNTSSVGSTIPLDVGHTVAQGSVGDIGRTVAIIKEELGIDPVVGWLICLEGNEKGRDYRIHTDNNFIGRGDNMDICIRGDDTISRENHATISYDSREKVFYFTPGDGRSIVRLNDKGVFSTTELKEHDILEIGKTKLIFMPLCGDKFEWV